MESGAPAMQFLMVLLTTRKFPQLEIPPPSMARPLAILIPSITVSPTFDTTRDVPGRWGVCCRGS